MNETHDNLITASFQDLVTVYEMEFGQPIKLAYKLNHRVLFPGNLLFPKLQFVCYEDSYFLSFIQKFKRKEQ